MTPSFYPMETFSLQEHGNLISSTTSLRFWLSLIMVPFVLGKEELESL